MHRCDPKSFLFKILPINPYSSKILVLTSLQVHCFHRPEGEGYPRPCVPESGRSVSMQTAGTI